MSGEPSQVDAGVRLAPLQAEVIGALRGVVGRNPRVISGTVTGSFLTGDGLAGVSDIDVVVVVDRLDGEVFARLVEEFRAGVGPVLGARGFDLHMNTALGPLKFDKERLAVLHLMIYSMQGHVDHVVRSPFTCLDWERSRVYLGKSLREVYPCFALQPRHFFGARRSAGDYLADLSRNAVSYRELRFEGSGGACIEEKCSKEMNERDRHEFAYHIVRFLMENLIKLVARRNVEPDLETLGKRFFGIFPEGREEFGGLFAKLRSLKKARQFSEPIADVVERTSAFVRSFERQFREQFEREATRHVLFRHAPTRLNARHAGDGNSVGGIVLQGRLDEPCGVIDRGSLKRVEEACRGMMFSAAWSSPLARCRETLTAVRGVVEAPEPSVDERLIEIDYGLCDGMTVDEARGKFPELFAAWERGEDPAFPGGESTGDVSRRVEGFLRDLAGRGESSVVCTHNVVLRCLVGKLMGVPMRDWYRLRIGHVAPITVVSTKRHGVFIELDEGMQREVFRDWEPREIKSVGAAG